MLSSLRNFFLALFISLLVFGTSAYFLVGFIDDNARGFGPKPNEPGEDAQIGGEDPVDEDNNGEPEDENINTDEFTAVIMGIDSGQSQYDEKRESDVIIVLNINAKTKTLMISSLSCDMKTEVKGYVLRLGAVYAEFDAETMLQTVRAYTGLQADFYCVIDYEGLEKVFDILGDVRYDVPMDMFYDPFNPGTDADGENINAGSDNAGTAGKNYETVDLKAGVQRINGEKAIQLLRFKDYSNGNAGRMATQIDFVKEALKQKMTLENLIRAPQIYAQLKESVAETNMDARDFENYAETLFSLAEFTIREVSYPGIPRNENGILFHSPDVKSAVHIYKEFRKGAAVNIEGSGGAD